MKTDHFRLFSLYALLWAGVLFTSCTGRDKTTITYQKKKVLVDARSDEYNTFPYYSKEARMYAQLSNDKENLYICLQFTNGAIQQQILREGMDIWIDTSSHVMRETGLSYPISAGTSSGWPGGKQSEALPRQFEVTGFPGTPNGIRFLDASKDIQLQAGTDSSGKLVYEICIPLKDWYSGKERKNRSAQTFMLTIDIHGMDSMPMAGPPGAGSPPPPGHQPPPMPPPGRPMQQPKPREKISYSLSFKLNSSGH